MCWIVVRVATAKSSTVITKYGRADLKELDTRNNRDFGGAIIQFVGAG